MKKILVLGSMAALVGMLYLSLVAAMATESPPSLARANLPERLARVTTTGDLFMKALQDGNLEQAYALLAPNVQQEFGSADGLKLPIEVQGVKPARWVFSSRAIENYSAELEGSVTYADHRRGSVQFTLLQNGADWQITGFWFR